MTMESDKLIFTMTKNDTPKSSQRKTLKKDREESSIATMALHSAPYAPSESAQSGTALDPEASQQAPVTAGQYSADEPRTHQGNSDNRENSLSTVEAEASHVKVRIIPLPSGVWHMRLVIAVLYFFDVLSFHGPIRRLT